MQPRPSSGTQQLFTAALAEHQAGRLKEAERLYLKILKADSRHADALHFLGVLNHQLGNADVAVKLIRQAIAQNPRAPAFHNNLGMVLFAQGKLDAAAAAYERALAIKPQYAEAHYNLGVALQALGKLDAAAAAYERALAIKPQYAEAHTNLGIILLEQGSLDAAVGCFERALALKADHAEAHNNLGNALRQKGNWALAMTSYQNAIFHTPDYAEAHLNLGTVLIEQGKSAEAIPHLERALLHKPDLAEAHCSLGTALKEQGEPDAALAAYGRALALKPDYAEARLGVAIAQIPIFADEAAASSAAAEKFMRSLEDLAMWAVVNAEKLGKCAGSNQPFYLAYRPGDVGPALSRYGDLMGAAAAAYWRPEARRASAQGEPSTRTRLLVVSGQVRRHPVWEIVLRGMIEHLDRGRFEIIVYHTSSTCDAETLWARARVDRFVQGPKSVKAWLDEMSHDLPDVIFYPEVGMDPATSALAALRLAPLQIAAWGHPVTTGLPSMDLFLSGELLEASGAEQHYREKLIRLPGTGVCTQVATQTAQPWEGPPRAGNIVRFTLCQQPIKFDPADDALLPRIAKAVGPCEFWLATPEKLNWAAVRLRDRLAAVFRAAGLDPDAYLRVTPWLPREQFVGFLDAMDIYLDCPAFSGYTTAWQAIHRGLPIVTLEGHYLRQRLAAALLRQIGRDDQIAVTHDGYVDIARRLATEILSGEGRGEARRDVIRRAAPRTDGNVAAIEALERAIIAALKMHSPSARGKASAPADSP
jgi:predicted O-linked N-acetylglucosamine transferase (SPINDLY family)